MTLIFSITLVAGIAALVVWYFRFKHNRYIRLVESLNTGLLAVRLGKTAKETKDFKDQIALSEQLFGALTAFKKPFSLEVAVPHVGEEIMFYVAVSRESIEAVTRQIQGLWGDAQVERAHDYNIFNPQGEAQGVYLGAKNSSAIPFRTYQEVGSDTFELILGGFSRMREIGEGAALQIIVRPAEESVKKGIMQKIKALKSGKSPKVVFANEAGFSFADIGRALNPQQKNPSAGAAPAHLEVDEELVAALQKKITKPLFNVNVRLVVSALTMPETDMILDGVSAGFTQLSSPQRNEVKLIKPKNMKKFLYQFSFRDFDSAQALVLNSEELASMYHLPISTTAVPNISTSKFREAAPPINLPKEGIILGQSRYRGLLKEVRISQEDRRRHLYVIGQTGTGKSVTLKNLALQDMQRGDGMCVIDPNGDLVEDLLSLVPKERVQDVIVFDPSDLMRPLGINMLEYDPAFPEQKTLLINELLNIFDTLYDLKATGGPMFEQYLRYTLLLLMDDPSEGATLMEVPRVLSDKPFRARLLAKCKNQLAKDFWEKEAEKAGGEAALQNMVPYITSKFNTFVANDFMRPIIAQSKSTLNFRQIMDEKKILLVNLSKGRIGELNARLLGMIVVGKLTISAFSRADVAMEERKDFYLHIDEFQNFTTPSIATILSEARKYRLCLTAAHQYIAQLKEEIKNAIFGNVGSLLVFRVGADDAEYLAKQFEPTFTANDLMNIANLNGYAKLIMNGVVAAPFNIFVAFPPQGDKALVQSVKDLSRQKFGRNVQDIEEEVRERAGR